MATPGPETSGDAPLAATSCENIGPRQRQARIRIGIGLLLLGDLLAVALVVLHADRALRLVVLAPFVAGSISLFQVRARTCVMLAARRVRDLDQGEIPVTDARELKALMSQAKVVLLQGISVGLALTAIVFLLP